MKQSRITRRDFFKLSAFGVGTLTLPAVTLASVTIAPPREAQAAAEQPDKLAIPQPTFNPIASTTAFGPPTDISAGWDGTLWAIDASGAPHLYDPLQNQWNPHGDGVDAVAAVGNTLYLFKSGESLDGQSPGGQVIQVNLTNNQAGAPAAIGTTWPALPDSFKIGVTGAANLDGTLYLFKGGWFLPVSAPTQRAKLTAIQGWPTTPNWVEGVIDAVVSNGSGVGEDGTVSAILTRGSEYIVVDFKNSKVIFGPVPINAGSGWKGSLPADWLSGGWDGAVYLQQNGTTVIYVYRGPQVASFPQFGIAVVQPKYIASIYANWPATWNPMLNHAPSGRMGNLWCATTAHGIVQHDGENWNTIAGISASVAVGQDNSVYVVSGDNQTIDTLVAGTGWVATARAPVPLTKVAVGDDDHVFALGNDSSVHRLVRSSGAYSYTPVDLGAGVPNPTHMAANADGTLWHCNSGNANAQRFISEGTSPSAAIPIKNGVVTGVLKVASTGFGAGHVLVTQSGQSQPQVYRYDSPYVFKTSNSYDVAGSSTSSFAQGLGNLYFVEEVSSPSPTVLYVRFVALDQHTGREVASYTPPGSASQYTGMVFDPINELVYVASAPVGNYTDNNTPGTLYALDARTLAVKWTSSAYRGIDATPALSGTTLCFGDRIAQLYCIDTQAALAAAAQGKPIPNKWVFPIDTNGPVHRVSTPLFNGDQVLAMMWDLEYDPSEGLVLYTTVSVAVNDGSGNNFGLGLPGGTVPKNLVNQYLVLQPPLVKPLLFPGYSAPSKAIIVRAVNSIIAWNLETQNFSQLQFNLPGGNIATALTYDDGTRLGSGLSGSGVPPSNTRLWFGDDQGNLWSLDQQFHAVDGTPYQVLKNTQVYTAPVLYKDPEGGLTVLFGVYDSSYTLPPSLYGYDPDNGNHASVPAGLTPITTLSPYVTNGVVYAGGRGGLAQVFGIRVDELPQALRDFVIESQMMQDPDPSASGGDPVNNVPPSVARYQTHLTVVDDLKAPQIHEPIKIWCDTANTKITVDGQSFTIGPDDASFAAVKTGADGSLVIIMDATDYFAPTLRVWAGFMDPYERIVINPDAEFHQRVMTAHADANDDDPDKVNLMTATNYNGKSLFTADEKNQNPSAPQNVANSIQQVNKGLGLSNTNSKGIYRKLMRAMGIKHKNQRVQIRLIESGSPTPTPSSQRGELANPPDKYMAYADLPGATHFPTNIPATRLASIVQPVGLSFARPNGDVTKAPTFTALSHADASAAIDALQGEAWKPTDPQGGTTSASRITPTRTFNIFQDFWNWLKGLLDKVLQCILSIAEDILAGIQYVVNGILHVFKAIIKVLEDVFPFLGSFFKMLEKLIDDVVMALSTLFEFGEIIKTHTFLRGELLGRMQQIKSTVTSQIMPAVDSFFKEGESAIKGFFDQLRGQLAPNQALSGLQGMGSTAHSAYRVNTPGGGTSSQAVQSSWATQKLKSGLGSVTGASFAANARPASVADDPIADFVTTFVNRITGDGDLSSAFGQLQRDIGNLLNPNSTTQFFSTLLTTLLDILETLLIGMLVVGNALADGLLAVVSDVIDALFDSQNGLLVAPLDIPILSWLYQQIFGEPLTFVNVILLVAAIPVTVVYRVAFGRYPSQDLPPMAALGTDGANGATRPQQATDAAKVIGIVVGLFSGIGTMVGGVVNGLAELDKKTPPVIGKVSLAIGGLLAAASFPISDITKPDAYDLAEFGLGLAGFGLGLVGLKTFEEATQQVLDIFLPFLNALINIGLLVLYIVQAAKEGISSGWQFAAGVISTLPGVLNPLKLINSVGGLVLGVVNGVVGFAVGALDLVAALTSINAPEPRPHRLYFPYVAH